MSPFLTPPRVYVCTAIVYLLSSSPTWVHKPSSQRQKFISISSRFHDEVNKHLRGTRVRGIKGPGRRIVGHLLMFSVVYLSFCVKYKVWCASFLFPHLLMPDTGGRFWAALNIAGSWPSSTPTCHEHLQWGKVCLCHGHLRSHPKPPLSWSPFAVQLSTPSCVTIDSCHCVGSRGCKLGWSQPEFSPGCLWLHGAHSHRGTMLGWVDFSGLLRPCFLRVLSSCPCISIGSLPQSNWIYSFVPFTRGLWAFKMTTEDALFSSADTGPEQTSFMP